MEIKCIKCKEMFKDNYPNLNRLNKRVWCDACILKEWNKRKLNNAEVKQMAKPCGRVGKCSYCWKEMTLKRKFFGLLRYRSCSCGYKQRF